jgi:hypothetical protein
MTELLRIGSPIDGDRRGLASIDARAVIGPVDSSGPIGGKGQLDLVRPKVLGPLRRWSHSGPQKQVVLHGRDETRAYLGCDHEAISQGADLTCLLRTRGAAMFRAIPPSWTSEEAPWSA